ncbi:HD domain-containing protein [Saprospiraceae bacterium]|nr:HD domain-containing protein [Saprospiraceae bacterium]
MSYQGAYNKIVHKLEQELSPKLTYHNLDHAKRVLESLDNHILTLEMDPRKVELVRLAGIGHDIGFVEGHENHELKGIQILKPILAEEGYSQEEIHEISAMIWATKQENRPRTFMEKMLVDADLAYLGSDNCQEVLKNLYDEWTSFERIPEDYPLFLENSIRFMEEHSYETDYAKAYNIKERNMEELLMKLREE